MSSTGFARAADGVRDIGHTTVTHASCGGGAESTRYSLTGEGPPGILTGCRRR